MQTHEQLKMLHATIEQRTPRSLKILVQLFLLVLAVMIVISSINMMLTISSHSS